MKITTNKRLVLRGKYKASMAGRWQSPLPSNNLDSFGEWQGLLSSSKSGRDFVVKVKFKNL